VLNNAPTAAAATRDSVHAAIAELGYVRGGPVGERAWHWRRSGFGTWLFHPAVTGSYPERSGQPAHPVPILGEPWPGVPVRGRGASARANACWVPVEPSLSPHGLRHTFKTLLDELGIPSRYKDELMGHLDGSVQARYSHITQAMRERLIEGMTQLWLVALDARRAMSPRSPVAVLDRLLAERRKEGE
jgi:hypothetical protein